METAEHTVPYERRIYRCMDQKTCGSVLYDRHIKEGGCPKCGNRRVCIATAVTDDDIKFLEQEGYEFNASDWMDEAEAVEKRRMEREVR
jgi:hypothetical protein